ncbi:MAG: threonine synthase [Gemmataceae bacterium]|nr:threonine synthase [Gemmataceae bacterium]
MSTPPTRCLVTHLESPVDNSLHPAGKVHGVHLGRPLVVRYDLEKARGLIDREEMASRTGGVWRWRELLPLPWDIQPVTLGEMPTPILDCPNLGREMGLDFLQIKDESTLPTGSFKSRGMTVAVSMAKWLGLKRLAAPTAGNAGGALAAYAARAGLEAWVFMPGDTPVVNQRECLLFGAKVFRVNGLIHECGKLVRENAEQMGWFDFSTLREPYRLEGKKTMGLELALQGGWKLPDVILYPTGGGTGLVGMWKAFQELQALGWLRGQALPRLYACQSDGCSPICVAFDRGERHAETFNPAHTKASGLRVPAAVGDFMILEAIRQSGGKALRGEETRLLDWMEKACSLEGISLCPESGVCLDVLAKLRAAGEVGPADRVLVWNTGAAQKYLECLPANLPTIDQHQPLGPQLQPFLNS